MVSNIGAWMYDAASGWLMTNLNANPLIVSLVQVANSLPMFLFSLPAGALADMVDKRRFILVLEILTTVFSALFATLVAWQAVTPTVLLAFVFLLGSLATIETPAWQSIVPPTGAASGPVLRDSNQQRRGQRQPRPRARAWPASSSWDWASRAPFWSTPSATLASSR